MGKLIGNAIILLSKIIAPYQYNQRLICEIEKQQPMIDFYLTQISFNLCSHYFPKEK